MCLLPLGQWAGEHSEARVYSVLYVSVLRNTGTQAISLAGQMIDMQISVPNLAIPLAWSMSTLGQSTQCRFPASLAKTCVD